MLQQIYRRSPCRRAISIKLCSNIIETAHLLRGCLLQICLQTLTAFIQNSLEKLLFVILTFLQAQFFFCIRLYLYRKQNSISNEFAAYLFKHINIIQMTISIRINNGHILSIQYTLSSTLPSVLVFYVKKENCHKTCR